MVEEKVIREVAPADAGAILDIYNPYILDTAISFEVEPLTLPEMEARIASISAAFPYYVYEEDGEILGYCYAHPWKERAAYSRTYETTIYLRPDAAHRGIGLKLMRHLIWKCRQQGCHTLIACITADNAASIAFHRSLGFREVSRFTQVGCKFGRWHDVVDMQLVL